MLNIDREKPVIILDGDDTLWKTQQLYDQAKMSFREIMRKQGFPDPLDFFNTLDAERVSTAMFSKTRFFESMLITYAMFCERYKKKWDIELESEIRNLGFAIFKFPPELYEDTYLVLRRLRNRGTLILFTNGDEEIQKSKIESLGKRFRSYFNKVRITAMKTEEEFKQILMEVNTPASKTWVVGNSVKSDINPAIKLGIKSILIPRGTWKYEESEFLPNNVMVASTLTEAAEIIEQGEIVDRRSRTTK